MCIEEKEMDINNFFLYKLFSCDNHSWKIDLIDRRNARIFSLFTFLLNSDNDE